MVSRGSQKEGEEIGVNKTPISTKEEGHAGRERVAGREEKKSSFTVQRLQEFSVGKKPNVGFGFLS